MRRGGTRGQSSSSRAKRKQQVPATLENDNFGEVVSARLKPCPVKAVQASQPSENLNAAQISSIREDLSWATRLPNRS
jgi:hypothetical protein